MYDDDYDKYSDFDNNVISYIKKEYHGVFRGELKLTDEDIENYMVVYNSNKFNL